jgi:hypothetical protein
MKSGRGPLVDWRHPRPASDFQELTIFRFPFFLENLLVLGLYSLMFLMAGLWASLPSGMGIRSVPFWLICITLFFNYVFVIVDHTSRGFQHVPKLSGELVFPTHDSRLFTITGLTACYFAFTSAGWDESSRPLRLIFTFFSYPLLFSFASVNRHFTVLLNPVRLIKSIIIFTASRYSPTFFLLQFVTGALLYFNIQRFGELSPWHLTWQVPITLTLLFLTFRALGVVINSQGPKLGIAVLQNEDTHIASLERAAEIRLSNFVMRLHRLARVHEYRKAFALIQIFQNENHNKLDEHLYARLCEWDDQRLTAMLGADLAERLLRDGEVERALKIFRDSYDMDPIKFAFSSGTSSLLFCKVAKDRASQERLFKYLQRFDQTFPNHPGLPAAMLQLATLALDRFSDPKIAREALAKAATYSPAITESQEYRRLMALCSA